MLRPLGVADERVSLCKCEQWWQGMGGFEEDEDEDEDDRSSKKGVADSQSAASCFWIRIEDIFSPFDAIQGNLKDMFNRETTGYLICWLLSSAEVNRR